MKKIVLLTAGFGEGHNAAARGIHDALKQIAPDCFVEIRDLFAEVYGGLNDLARRLYLGAINRTPQLWANVYHLIDHRRDYRAAWSWLAPAQKALARLIDELEPEALVAVYPAYAHLLDRIAGPACGLSPKRIVVITDSISVNAIWFRCSADKFLVANNETADVLARAGVAVDFIRVAGFPVNPAFARPRPRPVAGAPWRVLYMINAGKNTAPDLVRRLLAIANIQLTVAVGRDEALRRRVAAAARQVNANLEIVGWCGDLPALLARQHLLIAKAGGATVQEAIAAACPIVINQVVPGQEEGNAQLTTQTNAGAVALSVSAVVAALESAFADNGMLLREWSDNIAKISRPDASLRIAEYLLAL